MTLLFTLLGLVGITNIITRSYLFEKIRDKMPTTWLRYLVQCPTCMGTWVGFAYYLLIICPYDNFITNTASFFIWGGLSSLCSALVVACLDYIYYAKSALMTRMEVDSLKLATSQKSSDETKQE